MATTEVVNAEQDDEAWLYGDTVKAGAPSETTNSARADVSNASSKLSAEATPFQPGTVTKPAAAVEDTVVKEEPMEDTPTAATEVTEAEPDTAAAAAPTAAAATATASGDKPADENAGAADDDESDDDDDDVKVTIGDIKTQTAYDTPKFKSGYQRSGAGVTSTPRQQTKDVDLEATGNINGVAVYEFDIDSLQVEDRPWRKPGADITDYFNYGFNEDTWAKYCEKQRRLRMENNCNKIYMHSGHMTSTPIRSDKSNSEVASDSVLTSPGSANRQAGPPPSRKYGGTIDVIGSSHVDSRRPQQNFHDHNASAEAQDYKKYPPPGMANTAPPIAATHMPPPNYGVPPPGAMPPPGSMPPPNMVPPPQNIPPPGMTAPPPVVYPPVQQPFYPPGAPPVSRVPPPGFEDRPPYAYDNFGPSPYGAAPSAPSWDSRSSSRHSDEEFEVRGNYGSWSRDGRDAGRDRDGGRDRDRGRDREGRDRDRDIRDVRDSNRDRESNRDRDSTRDRDFSRSRDSVRDRDSTRDRDSIRDRDSVRDRDSNRDRDSIRDRDRDASRDRSVARDRDEGRDGGHDAGRDRDTFRNREGGLVLYDEYDDYNSPREMSRGHARGRDSPLSPADRDLPPRRHKDKEHDDKSRSRRRHHDSDEHRSKHKKSKRSRREAEEEDVPPGTEPPPAEGS